VKRWYHPRVSTYWWLWRWVYLRFILRELTSVAVACYIAILIGQICAVAAGPEAWAQYQEWLKKPLVVLVNAACLGAVLFHALTWFHLAPAAMVMRVGGKRVPDNVIRASNYAAWVAVSSVVGWFLLGA
jgi:fumarate reductase subunit C